MYTLQCLTGKADNNIRIITTLAVKYMYGRCMAFVTNVLILEPIVYSLFCALLKEDKTGKS